MHNRYAARREEGGEGEGGAAEATRPPRLPLTCIRPLHCCHRPPQRHHDESGGSVGKGDLPRPPGLLGRPHTLHHSSLLTKVVEPSCQSEPPCIILQLDLAACAARRGEVGSRRGQPASQAIHQPHKGKESLAATLIASPPGLCRRASSDGDTTRWREGSDRVRVRESPPVSLESDAGARGNFRVRLLSHS
jgi:hypothetical protein